MLLNNDLSKIGLRTLNMQKDLARNKLEIAEIKIELHDKHDRSYVDILENRIKALKNRNYDIRKELREGRAVYA